MLNEIVTWIGELWGMILLFAVGAFTVLATRAEGGG